MVPSFGRHVVKRGPLSVFTSTINLSGRLRLLLLFLTLSVLLYGERPTLSSAMVICRPTLRCQTCETHWLKDYWNPKRFLLCVNGKLYQGYCKDSNIFSFTLKCCVRSWPLEWKGCVGKQTDFQPTITAPTKSPENYTGMCGEQVVTHVVPAYPSLPGAWPWQVSLQWPNEEKPNTPFEHICGGTLINDQWILTAAHCFLGYKISDFRVILGGYNLTNPTPSEIQTKMKQVFIHPNYTAVYNHPNDVALIKITSPVKLSWKIHPICLMGNSSDRIPDYSDCWITGWGDTRNTGDPNVLNELKVTLTETNACNTSWHGIILPTQICVGNGLTGACHGDSGGPLVCRSYRDGRFVQIGVTSWGVGGCHTKGLPNIFTWLPPYMEWLQHIIKYGDSTINAKKFSSK
ncbi:elastase-1-like isoform X2 [Argonauta hians]